MKNEIEVVKVFMLKFLKITISTNFGPREHSIQEILLKTGVSIEMLPTDMQPDTKTLRGEQAKLGPALTLVYSMDNNGFATEHMGVPSWLYKYIISKECTNIKHMT
ncbi:vigilin [Nephila pilipes]|uniref:Vigilin n=1 Tax=Nephila pilipes TaxID=299642 RepID=A0A8X6MT19_NEPPI|nr:vigilin [Nephila pilipes]